MATKQLQSVPTPIPARSNSTNDMASPPKPVPKDTKIVVIIYGEGQERILPIFSDVLGKPYRVASSFADVGRGDHGAVVGMSSHDAKGDIRHRNRSLFVAINAHCVALGMPPDTDLSCACDYEFLYTDTPFFRRDLSRFISFTLGQISHHEALINKARTYFISTTFPDVRTALSNLDILSVGSDAVEIRVDLLKEPLPDGSFNSVPSMSYVGEQVMLLRQRTELPIIFTTRCTRENGRFPMENPELYYGYLYRAIQWGCEYIDVELWLPDDIRRRLWEQKGSSRIISAFHDFSGTFKWHSPQAQLIFTESRKYSDIVKMITIINSMSENYELEYFRSQIKSQNPDGPPLAAVNMGPLGQLSRALNTVFSPITHPLLPIVAAPGQLSAAEINGALSTMGQLPRKDIVALGSMRSSPQGAFFTKCFNELGLPHSFSYRETHWASLSAVPEVWRTLGSLSSHPDFGGAFINPPLPVIRHSLESYLPTLSDAARIIGAVDTIVVHPNGSLVGENATWKGIRATLTREFAPSAYANRAVIIMANNSWDAASVIFAVRSLGVGRVYAVGFTAQGPLSNGVEKFTSMEDLQPVDKPVAIISALSPEMCHLCIPLLRHFGEGSPSPRNSMINSPRNGLQSPRSGISPNGNGTNGIGPNSNKIFIDLSAPTGLKKGNPMAVAEQCGWIAYGVEDTSAFATVEVLRLLVGQNVPYSFVRLAGGRGLC